jgi:multiple sugar transport system permease protein
MAAAAAGVVATLALARWAEGRFARAAAFRTAVTTAAYLELVIPPPRRPTPPPAPRRPGSRPSRTRRPVPPLAAPSPLPPASVAAAPDGTEYDVAQLLVQARALTTLPGWTAPVEVYHGTAPLVDATAPPLPAAELGRLRRQEPARWRHGAALVPLKDRRGVRVVGAVAVGLPRGRGVWDLLLRWAFPAALLTLIAAGAVAFERAPPRTLVAAGLLLGLAAYADVRGAARRSTDHWLTGTRLLLREAATRLPTPRARVTIADLASLVRGAGGGELVPADSGSLAPRRFRFAGEPRAAETVRLGSGRWIEVRTVPGEAYTGGWLLALLGLALTGPLAALGLRWAERMTARPRELRETAAAWAFVAPAGLHLALFSFGPLLLALYLSVHRWVPADPVRPFVGFANVGAVLRDPLVWVSLRNTMIYTLYVPVSMAIALVLALALEGHDRAVRLARTALLLPYVSSVVAVGLLWQWLYHADVGLINRFLSGVGVGPFDWLGRPRTALLVVILLSMWVHVGYQLVVFRAGLQGIPRAYLDAARVDGANAWQRFWRVTFPLLRPVTVFLLVTGVIGAVQVFTYVYVLTSGGPLHATDVVAYRIYQSAWQFAQFGYASALSLLVFLILFAATWAQFRVLTERVEHA